MEKIAKKRKKTKDQTTTPTEKRQQCEYFEEASKKRTKSCAVEFLSAPAAHI